MYNPKLSTVTDSPRLDCLHFVGRKKPEKIEGQEKQNTNHDLNKYDKNTQKGKKQMVNHRKEMQDMRMSM